VTLKWRGVSAPLFSALDARLQSPVWPRRPGGPYGSKGPAIGNIRPAVHFQSRAAFTGLPRRPLVWHGRTWRQRDCRPWTGRCCVGGFRGDRLSPELITTVRTINPGAVRMVIDTHWHFDHVGGNEALARAAAVIVAQHNVQIRMAGGGTIAFAKTRVPPAPRGAVPTRTFFGRGPRLERKVACDGRRRAYAESRALTNGPRSPRRVQTSDLIRSPCGTWPSSSASGRPAP
jgi:hypothetical protein